MTDIAEKYKENIHFQEEVTSEPITNSGAFRIVGNPIEGYMLTVGRSAVTKKYKTKEEITEIIESLEVLDLISTIAIAVYTEIQNQKNNKIK